MRQVAVLVGATALFWAVLALPARAWWGDAVLVPSLTALALCLVPAVATLAWALQAGKKDPAQQPLVALAGTGVRLFGVAGGGVLLQALFPAEFTFAFWVWALLFYLFTLALEVALLVGKQPAAARPPEKLEAHPKG